MSLIRRPRTALSFCMAAPRFAIRLWSFLKAAPYSIRGSARPPRLHAARRSENFLPPSTAEMNPVRARDESVAAIRVSAFLPCLKPCAISPTSPVCRKNPMNAGLTTGSEAVQDQNSMTVAIVHSIRILEKIMRLFLVISTTIGLGVAALSTPSWSSDSLRLLAKVNTLAAQDDDTPPPPPPPSKRIKLKN